MEQSSKLLNAVESGIGVLMPDGIDEFNAVGYFDTDTKSKIADKIDTDKSFSNYILKLACVFADEDTKLLRDIAVALNYETKRIGVLSIPNNSMQNEFGVLKTLLPGVAATGSETAGTGSMSKTERIRLCNDMLTLLILISGAYKKLGKDKLQVTSVEAHKILRSMSVTVEEYDYLLTSEDKYLSEEDIVKALVKNLESITKVVAKEKGVSQSEELLNKLAELISKIGYRDKLVRPCRISKKFKGKFDDLENLEYSDNPLEVKEILEIITDTILTRIYKAGNRVATAIDLNSFLERNAPKMHKAGADILVAGTSSVFSSDISISEGTEKLRKCIELSE